MEKFKFSVLPFSSENFRLLLGRERGKTGKLLTQVEVRKSSTTGLELGAGWGENRTHSHNLASSMTMTATKSSSMISGFPSSSPRWITFYLGFSLVFPKEPGTGFIVWVWILSACVGGLFLLWFLGVFLFLRRRHHCRCLNRFRRRPGLLPCCYL